MITQPIPLAAKLHKHPDTYAAMWTADLYENIVVAHGADRTEFNLLRLMARRWNTGNYSHTPCTRFRALSHKGTVLFVRVE